MASTRNARQRLAASTLPSQSTHQEQDDKDDDDETHTAAWIPAVTVIPGTKTGSTDERKYQKDDYQYPK
jgi:hypothetical protein